MNRIDRAIDIFLDALNDGTLEAGQCTTCAVGSLVRAGMIQTNNYKEIPSDNAFIIDNEVEVEGVTNSDWAYLFVTHGNTQFKKQAFCPFEEKYIPASKEDITKGLKAISYTEFTEEELAKIEYAFETNTKGDEIEDQIKGLEAVVKIMQTFDEDKREVKEIFTNKAYALA